MTITLESNNVIVIIMPDHEQEYRFCVEDGSADLTKFAKAISENRTKISPYPISYRDFIADCNEISALAAKLAEYIYKIVAAFNDAYDEVFNNGTNTDDSTDVSF